MTNKLICKKCGKVISGSPKVHTHRRKLGSNILNEVNYYHEDCFGKLNLEDAWNEHKKKEAKDKTKNRRKVRRRR